MSTQLLPPPLTDPEPADPYVADPQSRRHRGRIALVAAVAGLWSFSGIAYWVLQSPTPRPTPQVIPCHVAGGPLSVPANRCSPPLKEGSSSSNAGSSASSTGSGSSASNAGSSTSNAGSSFSSPAPVVGNYNTSPTQMTMGASGTVTLPAGWVGFVFSSPTLNADVANAFPGHPDVVSKLMEMIRQAAANHQTFVAMSKTGADASFISIVAPNLNLAAGAQSVISREIANGAKDLKTKVMTWGGMTAVRIDSTASVNLFGGGTGTEHVVQYLTKDSMDRFYMLTEHTADLARDQQDLDSLAASVSIHGMKM